MTTFTIPGKPFGKQRARVGKFGAYTPKETVNFENVVRTIAAPLFPEPLQGPVRLMIWASFEPAKSWSKRKVGDHIGTYHTQKPDLDNCAKAISDALNRIAFADDSQVAWIEVRKIWAWQAQTVVTVEELN